MPKLKSSNTYSEKSDYIQTHVGNYGEILHFEPLNNNPNSVKLYNEVMEKWIPYKKDISLCTRISELDDLSVSIDKNPLTYVVVDYLLKLGYKLNKEFDNQSGKSLITQYGLIHKIPNEQVYFYGKSAGIKEYSFEEFKLSFSLHELIGREVIQNNTPYMIIDITDGDNSESIITLVDRHGKELELSSNKLVSQDSAVLLSENKHAF